MRTAVFLGGLLLVAGTTAIFGADAVSIHSPGFPPSRLEADGRLVEDWGTVGVRVSGKGVVEGPSTLEAIKLDEVIPAARLSSDRGAVTTVATAFRAPAYPAGVDVLNVRVQEAKGQPAEMLLSLDIEPSAQFGMRTVRIGGRTILTLPSDAVQKQELLEWGYCDEAVSLPGWAKPQGKCDPAFKNIRAGMGGVPISYRLPIAAGGEANVLLGLCESHWAEPGRRPLVCRVEGAPQQQVDPVAKWGQHKPGVLLFKAKDSNRDGKLELSVQASPGAQDRNPILNAIWVFPRGESPNLEKTLAGELSSTAVRYVDVGGTNDQSIFPPGKMDYRLKLPAGGAEELTFFVASPGGSAPVPDTSAWTAEALRRAAREVWRDWSQE
ncbi:MAG: hypothetical protein RBS80_03405 [Thermoguttaceae bacterium]|jgi:hypothetical protein|nr:hypothetical protein [Thermoguttaceae bacterium]